MYKVIENSEKDCIKHVDYDVKCETETTDSESWSKPQGNRIIDMDIFCKKIESSMICKICQGTITMGKKVSVF